MKLIIVDSGECLASDNMKKDSDFLENYSGSDSVILHLYDWKNPSVTHGCFVDYNQFLNVDVLYDSGFDIAKRPTGGGIVFHNIDIAFSIFVPSNNEHFSENVLENYAFINEIISNIIEELFDVSTRLLDSKGVIKQKSCKEFCMAFPTKYDVLVGNKKVCGAAQRKNKKGFLHQGSIFLKTLSCEELNKYISNKNTIIECKDNIYPLLGTCNDKEIFNNTRLLLKQKIIDKLIKY